MLSTLTPASYGHLARLGIARDATTSYEEHEDYDPLVDGISRQSTEKTKWDSPASGHNGFREKYRQQIQRLTSSGHKGFRSEKSNAEAFVSRGLVADVKETRCRRIAEARSADGQWSFSSSSTTTSTFVVSKGFCNGIIGGRRSFSIGPKITEMDLDTIESTPNLDHTHQKGKSELAQKGSLGHRRPPTRAGLKSFVSSVWDHTLEERSNSGSSDANHNDSLKNAVEIEEKLTNNGDENITSNKVKEPYVVEVNDSEEIRSSDSVRDEPEGREDLIQSEMTIFKEKDEDDAKGWKHPPKHAVLVFPMQLLNNSPKTRAKSPVNYSSNEHVWSPSNRFTDGVGQNDETMHSDVNNLPLLGKTTVRISTSESPSSSDSDERSSDLTQTFVERRCSAPTVVSITLKEPLGVRIGEDSATEDFQPSELNKTNSPTVIPFGKFRNAPIKPERTEGPTKIMIRPFGRSNSIEDKTEDNPCKDRDTTFITEYNPNRLRHQDDNDDENEDTATSRSAGVQVRIGGIKISPKSPTPLNYPSDTSSSPEPRVEDNPRCRKMGTSGLPSGIKITPAVSKQPRATPTRSNTVVFIKPNHPPPPPPTLIGHSNHVSRSMSTRVTNHSSKNDFTSHDNSKAKEMASFGEVKTTLLPTLKERCSSVSSLDVSSTKSNDSSKDGSISGSPMKPSRKDPNLRQRVQIQTWDRRSQQSASPCPSRSKIRELVMSTGTFISQGRPSSVDGEMERLTSGTGRTPRLEPSDESTETQSRRGSPSGYRYTPSPHLKLSENKPDWLKKIDLDRRKVIDWESVGNKRLPRSRQDCLEPASLQTWPDNNSEEEVVATQVQEKASIKTEQRTEIEERTLVPVRKDTPIPRFNRPPAPPSVPQTIASIKEEPEWIRIAEKKRKSDINWDEISAFRSATEKIKENREIVEDSNSIGVQVKLRKPKIIENETKIKEVEENTQDEALALSKIPRTLSRAIKEPEPTENEAHVVQNILSKVRESRKEVTSEFASTSNDSKIQRGRSSIKMEMVNERQKRSHSSGHTKTPWSEKEVIIEDLPKLSSKNKSIRVASPVTLRNAHRKRDRPLSMMELNNISQDLPTTKPHSSSRPPTSGGYADSTSRSSRNPVEAHRSRHSKTREYRRSASYDRNLQAITSTSGSDEDDDRNDSNSDTPAGKKKVRFLINGNRELKPEPPKSYTMFGMDPPLTSGVNDGEEFQNVKNKNMSSENTEMDDDDYQLQAYKIINRIKSMSKSRTPSPDRNGSNQRSSSLQRSSSGENTPPKVISSSKHSRKSRHASPESGTRSSKETLSRSSRKQSQQVGGGSYKPSKTSSRRAESPSNEIKRKETKRSESTRASTKSPDWTKKSTTSKKSSVDWEALDRGPNTSSKKPVWAELKLKRTPYSNQFLTYRSSDADDLSELEEDQVNDNECNIGDDKSSIHLEETNVPCMSLDAFVEKDNEEVSLIAEKKHLYNGDVGYYTSITNLQPSNDESKIKNTQTNDSCNRSPKSNGFPHSHQNKLDKSHLPSLMDSEGYSSMDSFSCKALSSNSSTCLFSNCNKNEKWTTNSAEPAMPVVINTVKKIKDGQLKSSLKKRENDEEEEFVVHHYSKDYHWNELDTNEPTLPPPPPLHLGLRLSSGPSSDTEYRENVQYITDDERKVSKPKRCVSMRVEREIDGDEVERKSKRGASRRNSLLESRKKLMDILGNIEDKSTKRGPQIKTIRKTIRRILRGSEVTDEEEEIVEEITEEVYGIPGDKNSKSIVGGNGLETGHKKRATITRTVHQTKDGQRFLTTTMVNENPDEKSSLESLQDINSEQRTPTVVRVVSKRIR